MVDLDAEKGRQRTPPELCYVVIRPTKQIRMAVIQSYLSKQMPFDNSVLEAISKIFKSTPIFLTDVFVDFLDHAIRQWPSEQYTSIKRSFFSRGANSYQIDNCIVAMKGVYTSIRLCDVSSALIVSPEPF
jgi:eukaryotic translation initiation factor 2C